MNKQKVIDNVSYQSKREIANKLRIEATNKKYEKEKISIRDKIKNENEILRARFEKNKKT